MIACLKIPALKSSVPFHFSSYYLISEMSVAPPSSNPAVNKPVSFEKAPQKVPCANLIAINALHSGA
jgi:hypothetical protein